MKLRISSKKLQNQYSVPSTILDMQGSKEELKEIESPLHKQIEYGKDQALLEKERKQRSMLTTGRQEDGFQLKPIPSPQKG